MDIQTTGEPEWKDRHTDGHMDGQTDEQTGRQVDRWRDCVDKTDKWNRQMDGQNGRRTD